MRQMISLIDKLRDFKLDNYISLPRIAVLGEQSAGKSSLLESVAGLNFLPRGTGIVTRRPLELRMVRSNVMQPYFVFPKDFPDKKFTKYEEIVQTIEALTDKATNNTKTIVDTPIVCTVYSPTVPDLTLIDLPGITRNAVEGQPANIEEISKNLVAKYCSDNNTLILCVIPANIDLSTSDALSFVRKLDPDGSRTLGVVTKIDIMNEGEDCRDVLLNKLIPLKHGYVGVRGRTQLEIKNKTPVADAMKKEMDFFSKDPVYSTLPMDSLGTQSLINKMSTILFNLIKGFIPELKAEVSNRIRQTKVQLEALGEDFPDKEEKKLEMIFRMVRKFTDNFNSAITGKYIHDKKNDDETLIFQINTQFIDLFKKYAAADFRASSDLTDERIERALETYQAASMPGFSSIDSFLALINPKLETLKDPILQVLEEGKSILETKGLEHLEGVFKKYPKLNLELKEAFSKFLVQERNTTRKILENLARSEENYLFTNDPRIITNVVADKTTKSAKDLQVREMRLRIDAYFQIVVENLRNFVPKIIGQFLVKHFNSNLELELLNSLSKRNYCLDALVESEATSSSRTKLKEEVKSLMKADNLLVSTFGQTLLSQSNTQVQKRGAKSKQSEITPFQMFELDDIENLNDNYIKFNEQLAKRVTGGFKQGDDASLAKFQNDSYGSTKDKYAPKSAVTAPHINSHSNEINVKQKETPVLTKTLTQDSLTSNAIKTSEQNFKSGESVASKTTLPSNQSTGNLKQQPVTQPQNISKPVNPQQNQPQKKDYLWDTPLFTNTQGTQPIQQPSTQTFKDPRMAGANQPAPQQVVNHSKTPPPQTGGTNTFSKLFGATNPNPPNPSQQKTQNPAQIQDPKAAKNNLYG